MNVILHYMNASCINVLEHPGIQGPYIYYYFGDQSLFLQLLGYCRHYQIALVEG